MTTRATAIANQLRQIRHRNQPKPCDRSPDRLAHTVYARADVVYLDADTFTAIFPHHSLLFVSPTGPAVPRGRTKADALAWARLWPAHSPAQLSDSSQY